MKGLLLALALVERSLARRQAQDYPNRDDHADHSDRFGGGNDAIGRVVADRMSLILGQQIVPENRGGAGGTLATKAARAKARRTATRLAFPTAAPWLWVRRCIPTPATIGARISPRSAALLQASVVLVVGKDVPARSVAELIELAKKEPGQTHLRQRRRR